MTSRLAGRTAVVTGGGTGIGLAVAVEFVRAGDSVTITGRREHVLKEAAGRLATAAGCSTGAAGYVCFDASDPAGVCAALELLPACVDVLVNNAGGNTDFDREPVRDGDLAGLAAAWRANLDANLLSAVLVTAALTPGSRGTRESSRSAPSQRGAVPDHTARRRQPWRPGPRTSRPNWGRAASQLTRCLPA